MSTQRTSETIAAGSPGVRAVEFTVAGLAALATGVWVPGLFPQDPTAAVFGIPTAIAMFFAVTWVAQAIRRIAGRSRSH